MEYQGKRRCRLVLVPCPFQGHLNPMLQLGTLLYSKGFSITVAHTKFNFHNTSNHPDFNFILIPDGSDNSGISSVDIIASILLLNVNYKTPFQECLARLMEQQYPHGETITCIIYDEFMYFSEAAANQFKLPSIILRTASASSFIARNFLPKLKEEGNILLQGLGSEDMVPELHPLRLKDLPYSKFGSVQNVIELVDNARNIRKSSAFILNTTDCLEESSLAEIQQQYQVPIFTIGPMHKLSPSFSSSLLKEDIRCITWLDKQANDSVIYASLGTITLISENELMEMAWGLANSKQPFLWVVRPGSVCGSNWIESLPVDFKETIGERGCIVEWAPQKEVLAHAAVGGFWSHCGWNSTLESVSEGVPMICKPNSSDQKVNARYISHVWGVGLEMENELDRGKIESAVRRLMVDKEGMKMRQRAKDLKEMVQHCTKEGGSSYNSFNRLVKFITSL